ECRVCGISPSREVPLAWGGGGRVSPLPFLKDVIGIGREESPRRGAGAPLSGCRGAVNLGPPYCATREPASLEKACRLRIPEFVEQSPGITINRLLPHPFSRPEVARHDRDADPGVQSSAIESDEPAFAITEHSDTRLVLLSAEPIDSCQHFLD